MNIHTAENYEAAQQIIKALALPTASGAPVAPRPLPLSHLPRLPSETSMGVRHRACRSFWEGHDPRNHRCLAVGVRPAELVAPPAMVEFRLIADYIPLVEKAVTKGTRRVYGPYWARVVREWGYSRVNEPTALEISQLAEQVRAGAVQRRNTGGGRGAAEHLIGALLARRYPETQTISLVLDVTTANVALFAIAAHADEREAHIREVERSGQNLPEGSYGRRNRQAIAARETRVAARLRAVEQAYRTATEHGTASRRPSPPGHSVLQSVRPTGRWSLSKRPANPCRTVADSAAARCLHCGGWAVSERYPRSGDSEFTPAGKPFATRAHGPLWSTRFAGQIGSLPLVRAIPDQGNGAIQFGSAAYNPAMGDHLRSREYTATAGVWPGHGRRNPGLSDEAALIRISPEFGLTRKGKSRIIGRQE